MKPVEPRRGSASLGCLGTVGLFSMILLTACLVTDFTLSKIFRGEIYAVRFMLPFSVVERELGGKRRVAVRCLTHSVEFFKTFFEAFQTRHQTALGRSDRAYKPVMELPDISQRTEEARYHGSGELTLFHMMARRGALETDDPYVKLSFPYLDWNAIPLVPVRSRNDLLKLFPDLAYGLDVLFEEDPSGAYEQGLARFPTLRTAEEELFSVSLAYGIDAFGAQEKRRLAQKTATVIVFPLLIALLSFLYYRWRENLSMLPIRVFAALYPFAMFMEVTQPTCYIPGSGRLQFGDIPALRSECRRVIAELAKDGTLDPEMKALLEAATADPTTLRQK